LRVAFKFPFSTIDEIVKYILTGFSNVELFPRDSRPRSCYITYDIAKSATYWFVEKSLYYTVIPGIRGAEALEALPIGEYSVIPCSLLGGEMALKEEFFSPKAIHRGHLSVRRLLRELTLDELEDKYYVVELNDAFPLLSLFRGISRYDLAWARVVASYELAEIIRQINTPKGGISRELKERASKSIAAVVFDLIAKLTLGAILSHYWSEYAYAMWLGDVKGIVEKLERSGFHRHLALAEYATSRDAYISCLKVSERFIDDFVERVRDLKSRGAGTLRDFKEGIDMSIRELRDYCLIPIHDAFSFLFRAIGLDCDYARYVAGELSKGDRSKGVVSVYGVTERASPLPFAILKMVLGEDQLKRATFILTYTVNTYDRLLLIEHFLNKASKGQIRIEPLPVSAWNVYTTYTTLRDELSRYPRDKYRVVAYSKTTNPATALYALLKLKYEGGHDINIVTTEELPP